MKNDTPNPSSHIARPTSRREFLSQAGLLTAGGLIVGHSPLARAGGFDAPTRRLQASIQGTVIAREAPDYELWRQSMIWQYRKFRRYPDLIVQAESEDDVVAAVNFARDNGMKITTRSGGHSWSGCFLRDSGVLVDLSRLQSIEVDASRNVARVGAGVLGRGLNEELARYGLAFPTAHCGMVPVSGYLLGGGLGWNSTAWGGMSVFNVVGIEAVTVEGEKIFASQNKNPDLFWAARGGGPGLFFTVTAFHLQCHPLPASMITDSYFFHYADLDEVVALMEEVGPSINPNVEMLTVVVPTIPELAKQCEGSECDRVVVLAATAFGKSEADSKAMLAPIANHRAASKSLKVIKARPTPFEVLYQDNEGPFPQRRARADNIYTNRASDTVPVISKYMKQSPSDGNTPVILWRGDLSFPDAAYSSTGQFYLAGYAQWNLAQNDQPNQQWLQNFYDEMQEFASGHYINEFDRETRSAQTSACFAPANWAKLGRLREQYDPDGVYHDFLRL